MKERLIEIENVQKKLWLLTVALVISSGGILVNSFIVSVPDWLGIALALIASAAILMYFIVNRKQAK